MIDLVIKQHEWAEIWAEFDRRFDAQEFQPRDKTQKRWLQQLINERLNRRHKQAKAIIEAIEREGSDEQF